MTWLKRLNLAIPCLQESHDMRKNGVLLSIKYSAFALVGSLLTGCWQLQIKEFKPSAITPTYLDLPFATMAYVQGGTFQMGDIKGEGESSELPTHQVTLSSFYMGQYEVTQRQWQAVMGSNPSSFTGCADCPVEQVSWDDVQEFLSKLNQQRPVGTSAFRLPTEAEWEYAAGGGPIANRTRFGNGKEIANSAEINYNGSEYPERPVYSVVGVNKAKTIPVGSFAPNNLRLYDLSGNVFEWCNDWMNTYTSNSQTNPTGAATGSLRILRGGSWNFGPNFCRVTLRSSRTPVGKDIFIGFRIVMQAQ